MQKKNLAVFFAFIFFIGIIGFLLYSRNGKTSILTPLTDNFSQEEDGGEGMTADLDPLSIETLRNGSYPGSEIVIEDTLDAGSNYQRYYVSYTSEGNKIYALLTVPTGDPSTSSGQGKPSTGWPVIIFNHGYIPPAEYRTTERYIAYVDGFARNGYIVFRSDYRGHGSSEGEAVGAYGSSGYTIDVLNAVASMKKYKDADPKRIGMWGHSLGGFVTLRSMVTDPDIKVGVIWAGVVASYPDLIYRWRRGRVTRPPIPSSSTSWRARLIELHGEPEENPAFWSSLSANSYLKDLTGPIQLHHGTADTSVPLEFSETLKKQMEAVGKPVELYTYQGDDHNIALNFGSAMQRSIEFFDTHLKGK